ncbi:N,N'-diacetylchitobiose transport system permease protein [Streptomyces sp. SAI-208]|uniref:carbohydrate ABC transporter permease n=1 Tax=unclassified Streptomyces TaxID=2593676 RepID=UPI0024750585|nr:MULTISPECIES: sugar ABC transporter permease [unclassified Streptomyces]MDH6516600.1 N,N'-diacetylchitobiose transport system permease protein [Streptomyces sp. SAI-090]MDH6548814.1 N,N'-diacetylchitobiose transport system permease protein [Streptomyces sp. SAI-041]MDH6567883.1 N,N'-diacetylchitobiose transport system permease protein [Streptomyces sp. SAI-117]MDH6587168.1 N,N'-diacetylchitobiose transport system permease protein [Streptomyces sp. SAI-133]MDH6607423.1 N,N'-diacetylchitobios
MSAADTTTPTEVPPPMPVPPPPRPAAPGRKRAFSATPWLLLAPCLLILVLVLGYPMVRLVGLSFQKFGQSQLWGFQPAEWVGFDNFTGVLDDGEFWAVVVRTVVFAAGCVIFTMVAGMLIALLLQRVSGWVKTLVNIALVASWGMPIIVATTVFKWLFDADYGILNALLSKLPGVEMIGHNWFASGPQGLAVIMLLVVWGAVPFVVITLSAGLTQVPAELEEAARLDGASAWGVFRYVTVPVLKPIIVMLTTLSVIWDMGVFPQVFVMRNGHPEQEFQLLTTYSYDRAFVVNDYAQGSAIALITVVLLLGVVAVYMRQMLKIGEVE